jgi:transcriptional regulator GlxA family with amidase domain
MPSPDVAVASGVGSREHRSYVFKRQAGLSPPKYRSRVRIR